MKTIISLFVMALVFSPTHDAQAFLCGKKCRAKKKKAKEHIKNGGNCTDLSGSTKRKCKRAARKIARKTAREECAGKGAKCRRKVRRDTKGQYGAYGFIGAKKANSQSKANWNLFNQRKIELDQLLASGQLTQIQYDKMIADAKRQRLKESNRIGRVKTIKTVAAVGVAAAAVATAGTVGAVALGSSSFTTAAGASGVAAVTSSGTLVVGSSALGVGAMAASGGIAATAAGATGLAASNLGRGRSRKLNQMDLRYRQKLANQVAVNQGHNQVHDIAQARMQMVRQNVRMPASVGNVGNCASLEMGSCAFMKCKCAQSLQAGGGRLAAYNPAGSAVEKICQSNAAQGFEGAWFAFKRLNPQYNTCQ